MIIASTGDIHADQHNIKDTKIGMCEMLKVLDDENVEILIITGDIFHNFNIGGKNESFGSVFHSINEPLCDFLAGDVDRRRIIMVPGNHDTPTNKESRDALTSFEFRDRIHVSRSIGAFKVSPTIMITTLPWMYPSMHSGKDKILKELIEIRKNTLNYTNILMGHCEIAGSEIATGYTMFGGHFEFDYKEIYNLDYDYVTLGHVHKAQGFYTGVPWQHNFGDEGLVGQIKIINVKESGEIHVKEVEIPNTPKYYNIDVKDFLGYKKKDIDYVKVTGSRLDVELPNGYKFEKKHENTEIAPRTNVSCNDTIEDLLNKWLKEQNNNSDLYALLEIIEEIGANESYGKKYGSLEFFDSIHIKGIGTHKDTKMDFNDAIIAISGPNGCGKTIFMECLFAGLYGELPSYGKLPALSDKKGELIIKFHTNNNNYKVVRKVKSGKQTAFVYKNDKIKYFIGPKVSEVNNYITKVVGPKELLLSSVFSTQIYAGDIVNLEPGKRKDVFHKLLGLGIFAEIKEQIDDRFKDRKSKREVLSNQVKIVKTLDIVEKEVVDTSTMMEDANKSLQIHEGKIVDYSIKLDKAESELKILDGILIAKNNTEKDLQNNRTALIKTNEKLERFEFIDISDIEEKIDTKVAEFLAMEDGYHKQAEEFEELERLTDVYNDKLLDLEAIKLSTEHIASTHEAKVKVLMDKTRNLEDIGCSGDPLPCPYINGARQAETELDTLLKDHAKVIKEWNNKFDLSNSAITKARIAKNYFQDNMIKYDKNAYITLKNEIKTLKLSLEEAENNNLKKEDLFRDVEYYLNQISQCKTLISDMKDDTDEKHIVITNQIQGYKDSLGKEQALATNKKIKIAEYRKDLKHLQEDLKRLTEIDDQLKELNEQIPKLETLSNAFGKDGIPQLIIDSALPQLQDILDILANYMNKFSIEIKTQKPNKDGTNAKETIDFIVDDGIKPRDVKFYSGGEKKLLKTLIRLSLSLFQSQRTGNSYKLLLMDETFDALDPDNSLILLKILYNLKTKFKQIFIISHSDDILGRLAKCIKFQRKGNRTIIDGNTK
jgi:DNA repair exonuclease SbcCD ATPase subunit/DNA repair exonuclease SbcCD nuclease subunit